MDLYILNKNFESIGIVDTYTDLIWTERYKNVDDFEMTLLVDDFKKSGIQPDFYIWRKGSQNLMVVEKFRLKKEEDEPAKIVISGRGLESMLERRITAESYTATRIDPDALMTKLIDEMFLNPKVEARKTDLIRYVDSSDEDIKKIKYSTTVKYESLLNIVLDICQSENLGFKAWFSDDQHFCYKFYKGVDRSWSQGERTWIVYSPKYNNLLSTTFDYDNTTYRNHILVYGEEASETTDGEGFRHYWPQITFEIDRVKQNEVEDGGVFATGINRRESTMDCSDVPRAKGDWVWEDGQWVEASEEERENGWRKLASGTYQDILERKAYERMEQFNTDLIYEAEADEHMQWKFGESFNLGDIVQVVSEFGLESRCRVESIIFSHDAKGIKYYPTFVSVDNKITQEGGTVVW